MLSEAVNISQFKKNYVVWSCEHLPIQKNYVEWSCEHLPIQTKCSLNISKVMELRYIMLSSSLEPQGPCMKEIQALTSSLSWSSKLPSSSFPTQHVGAAAELQNVYSRDILFVSCSCYGLCQTTFLCFSSVSPVECSVATSNRSQSPLLIVFPYKSTLYNHYDRKDVVK